MNHTDSKLYTNISSISRLLEEQSYFAIRPTFSDDGHTAKLPIALSLHRSERAFSHDTPAIRLASPMAQSVGYSYRAQHCDIVRNANGTYNLTLPVTERIHAPGAEEDMVIGNGAFTIGRNLNVFQLNLALTKLYGTAGYFENNSLSYRMTKAMMEVTGTRRKIPTPIAQLFPARRDMKAYLIRSNSGHELRLQLA